MVAGELVNMLKHVHALRPMYVNIDKLYERYQIDAKIMTGEEYLHALAAKLYRGNLYSAADRLMADFRKGHLGPITLETPPEVIEEEPLGKEKEKKSVPGLSGWKEHDDDLNEGYEGSEIEEDHGHRTDRELRVGEGDGPKIGVGQFEGW